MSKAWRYLLLAIASCLIVAQPLTAEEAIKGNLVNARWLEKNLGKPDVVLLDASLSRLYAAKHIPGAINADVFTYLIRYGIGDTPVAEAEKLFQSWGVSPGKKIVMYDAGGSNMATRLLFSLAYHGFPAKNLLILDGGLSKWQELGLPVTKDPTPAPAAGSFKVKNVNAGIRVRLPEVLAATGDPAKNAVVEALDPDWHFGGVQAFDRAGHIPNARLMPVDDFYNPDKTFKSPDEIRKMLAYQGITPQQQIYTYCGGGVAASVPFFALKYLVNYPDVKLFPESELGWLGDQRELPYWTYDAPALMRTTNWLQWAGGQRIRTFLGASVSIVDIRPTSAFNEGHVPYALNVPAELFRNNVASPAKLAELLGPAGVDVSHEAVVISGAGLTREAALAFLMLETLGQKRVSVFMDSMDQWTKGGFALKKDPTVVATGKGRDAAIPPTAYPANARKDVIITDANSTHGIYPKVFIASGKEVPAKSQEGKVVHIPYADLLNADGTPKAAKEIWTILSKAGVPRYAEIVCFSDDPGEAAANYYILKLMGFPDVKVLVI